MTDPTTARAQRRQAVQDGRESDAVDRRTPRSNPGGRGSEPPSQNRQRDRRREIADELDIEREGIGAVERIAGLDVFLRSRGEQRWGDQLRDEFAGEADFVQADDVDPQVDGQEIAADPVIADDRRPAVAQRAREQTAAEADFVTDDDLDVEVGSRGVSALEIADDRRDNVADRARQQTAAEADFVRGDDLDVEVGRRGIESLGVADDRRDDVADRARQDFADDDPFAEPDDFDIQVGQLGIEQAGLSDDGERRRAGRQFEAETPLSSVDPFDDITEVDDGFGLADPAQRRVAAREFESELDLFDSGDLDPDDDLRETDDGFGLGRDPAREVAAQELDDQFDDFSIGPDDIELTESDDGSFEAAFEREVRR